MHKIKLLVVGVSWPVETFLACLISGLSEKGFEITLASRKKPDSTWATPRKINWFSLALLKRFPFLVGRYNVIYFPWNSAAIENLEFFEQGIPAVVSCRGAQVNVAPHNPERAALREGLKRIFERANLVHCVSEAIQREAFQYGLQPEKSVIIRPAVDPDFFSPAASPVRKKSDSLLVISTGALIWRKGYEYALCAIRQLIDQGIPAQYEIIGDGPERQRILYTVQDLGLEENVFLSGWLSPEKVRDRLRDSDIFLLSSLSEGISNAVLEAMSCGLPVITTDCGGMREAIGGAEGFIVPVRDAGAVAASLKILSQKKELALRMGFAAREKIRQSFQLKAQVDSFSRLFEQTQQAPHVKCP